MWMLTAGLSRRAIIIAVIVSGTVTLLGVLVATYTFLNARDVYGVPINIDPGRIRMEDKATYLFMMLVFQTFIWLVLAFYAIRWNKFVLKAKEREAYYKLKFPTLRPLDMSVLYVGVVIFLCAFNLILLFWVAYRCAALLFK